MNHELKLLQLLDKVSRAETMRNEFVKRERRARQTKDENDIYSARMAEAIANEFKQELFDFAHRTKVELQKLNSLQKV